MAIFCFLHHPYCFSFPSAVMENVHLLSIWKWHWVRQQLRALCGNFLRTAATSIYWPLKQLFEKELSLSLTFWPIVRVLMYICHVLSSLKKRAELRLFAILRLRPFLCFILEAFSSTCAFEQIICNVSWSWIFIKRYGPDNHKLCIFAQRMLFWRYV